MTDQLAVVRSSRKSGRFSIPDDVAAAARGNRQAFERLYESHIARVFSLCMRILGDQVAAEEATQDVFVRLWRKLPTFRGESSFPTWLHSVTASTALNKARSLGIDHSRVADETDTVEHAAPQRDLPQLFDLETAMASLPDGARRVFVLHDVEGFTHEEIAAQMGITVGGSKAQLHRARLLLRSILTR